MRTGLGRLRPAIESSHSAFFRLRSFSCRSPAGKTLAPRIFLLALARLKASIWFLFSHAVSLQVARSPVPARGPSQPPKADRYSRYASFIRFRALSASALAEFVATTASYFFTAKARFWSWSYISPAPRFAFCSSSGSTPVTSLTNS
jgi:hypothetical protein